MTSTAAPRPSTLPPADPVPYPGIPAIVDGSEAVAHVESRLAEVACVYPITPSTTMAAVYQAAVADGRTNLWGTPLRFIEPESEHSSASAAEGAALAGGRVTNFTAGQGLVLMKEVLFVISGKRLPVVFHVGARALTSQALNIHAGHDDVMAVADCGWGMLFARNAQEAADLAAIARRAAEATETPFFVAQDGFLTTHTLENVRLPEDELLREFVGDPRDHIRDLFDPAEALMTGVVQNQDSYMKGRIGQRAYTDRIPAILEDAYDRVVRADRPPLRRDRCLPDRGRDRDPRLDGHDRRHGDRRRRPPPLAGPARSAASRSPPSARSRPASSSAALAARPGGRRRRADRRAARGREPADPRAHVRALRRSPPRAGWSRASCRSRPASARATSPPATSSRSSTGWPTTATDEQRHSVVGIKPPARPRRSSRSTSARPAPTASAATRSAASAASPRTSSWPPSSGELFGKQVQAYPRYGSEKKGLPTTYYLTIADEPIRLHAELDQVEFVPLHDVSAFGLGDPLAGLVDGGDVFIQSPLADPEAIWASIPAAARAEILARRIRVTALDTAALARRHAPAAGPPGPDAGRRPRRRLPAGLAVRGAGRARIATRSSPPSGTGSGGSSASAAARSSTPTSPSSPRPTTASST